MLEEERCRDAVITAGSLLPMALLKLFGDNAILA
jgi:hypothetical protein